MSKIYYCDGCKTLVEYDDIQEGIHCTQQPDCYKECGQAHYVKDKIESLQSKLNEAVTFLKCLQQSEELDIKALDELLEKYHLGKDELNKILENSQGFKDGKHGLIK
jgi:hypothetical protein